MDSSSRLLVFLGLSFTGLTAAVVYLLLHKDEETETFGGLRSSQRTVIKVKVPNECMGTVIGRGGCNVKAIQEKTGTRINCDDERANDKIRVVTIQGTSDGAQLAESMIHEIIMNQPLIISHEMFVPSIACGRIIGKGGDSIRAMTRISCAKIMVDSTGQNERSETRIVLKGTAEQINIAKTLIEEKVESELDMHHRLETSIANRSPRREPKDNYNFLAAPHDEQDPVPSSFKRAKFDSSSSDGFFDVFVSAANNPHQFWVQSVSPRGVELDQLVDKMTEYYTKPENLELHTLKEISVGQIVAAPFDHDDKWYRAEILSIEEDEYDPIESRVTLYYGDYGDSCVVKRKQLFDLRTDFLGLYFQAIECSLAHVKPIDGEWSTEASDLFEELAEVALWQKKAAHVVTYRDSVHKRGQRSGSPVPVIELHDKGVNIAEELVNKGYAAWESSSPNENPHENSPLKPINTVTSPPRPQSFNQTVNNAKQSSSDPRKMAPSSVFEAASVTSNPNKSSSDSSSFLKAERKQKTAGGFKPKTLESPTKKSEKKSTTPLEVRYVPELSDEDEDEDEDGFRLG